MIGFQEGVERLCLYFIKVGSDVNMIDYEGYFVLFYFVYLLYFYMLDVVKKFIKVGKLLFCLIRYFNQVNSFFKFCWLVFSENNVMKWL